MKKKKPSESKRKMKTPKRSLRKKDSTKAEMPELVGVMARLVEKMEGLERKMELVLTGMGHIPAQVRSAVQDFRRPDPSFSARTSPRPEQVQVPGQPGTRRERVLYKAVCADCRKDCEVPFKPTAERPVYCKECWVNRKAGHVPQDPDMKSKGPSVERKLRYMPSPMDYEPGQSKSFSPPPVMGNKTKPKAVKKSLKKAGKSSKKKASSKRKKR